MEEQKQKIIEFCLESSVNMCDEMSKPIESPNELTAIKSSLNIMEQLMNIAKTCSEIKA